MPQLVGYLIIKNSSVDHGPTSASFCLCSLFVNNILHIILLTLEGYELESLRWKACTLNTWSSPRTLNTVFILPMGNQSRSIRKTGIKMSTFKEEENGLRSLNAFFKWANPGHFFFIFVFSIQLTVSVQCKFLPMTGFDLQTYGVGSARSTNWASTTTQCILQ